MMMIRMKIIRMMITKVQDDEYDLFNPEFDSTNGEPYKKYAPNSRFFENPHGSLESEGEIDTPQLTSADSDSDSDSNLSDDDDDEPGYRTRCSTRQARQQQNSTPQPTRGSDAPSQGSTEAEDGDDQFETQPDDPDTDSDDSDNEPETSDANQDAVPPPPA